MTDDWSLKGKGFAVVSYTPAKIVKEEEAKRKYEILYSKKDIETLRQKLVEDTNNFQDMLLARLTSYLSFPLKGDKETMKIIKDVSQMTNELFGKYKNTINRRFGVEVEK